MLAIFLDVDGVLNSADTEETSPEGYIGVDDPYIKNLKYIVDNTNAEIILSSDWRSEWHPDACHGDDILYLIKRLHDFGLEISDVTPPGSTKGDYLTGRGAEITAYLNAHSEITEYVILDDNSFRDFSLPKCKGHVVITVEYDPYSGYDEARGLTNGMAKKAVKILKGETND